MSVKVENITETENAEIVKVEFIQVVSALDAARGFGNAKRHWMTASKDKNTFKIGQVFPATIKTIMHDEPQYEGHKPFERNGKYYTTELV